MINYWFLLSYIYVVYRKLCDVEIFPHISVLRSLESQELFWNDVCRLGSAPQSILFDLFQSNLVCGLISRVMIPRKYYGAGIINWQDTIMNLVHRHLKFVFHQIRLTLSKFRSLFKYFVQRWRSFSYLGW